jgi:hypothetical protein
MEKVVKMVLDGFLHFFFLNFSSVRCDLNKKKMSSASASHKFQIWTRTLGILSSESIKMPKKQSQQNILFWFGNAGTLMNLVK